ncbi:hypothetical protein GUJ93_ZPchr0008g13646 [Zizania palustris]|uniref:Uncharacterized protein n=1 Tax=Zizania palustris TaxID=103762 RepID=A0A8J5RIZ0_ZIZPA|nr:hypothetical protein GUJ93_ZPchr0008g13646 [Zizania palustris]
MPSLLHYEADFTTRCTIVAPPNFKSHLPQGIVSLLPCGFSSGIIATFYIHRMVTSGHKGPSSESILHN